jgi:hypothetical protein
VMDRCGFGNSLGQRAAHCGRMLTDQMHES